MNTRTIFVSVLTLLVLLAAISVVAFFFGTSTPNADALSVPLASDFVSSRPEVDALPSQTIDESEHAALLYMREEEKLARDVYMTLYGVWKIPVFSNIAQSEETHTEAVRDLLVKYHIADPVTDDTVGVFKDSTLAKLYTDLTTKGTASAVEALTVGAIIEDLDIRDLETRIAQTDNQDIQLVYENLMRGSRNHMRSFVSQLESRGGTYAPEYISASEYESIISTPRETGNGAGRGWGK